MTAPDSIGRLVDKFERDKSRFQQPEYNEAQLREEFVNPFFRALGWDLGEQVLHEAGLRSGGTIKHPDYTFLAGARRAFYVETKKPAIDIGSAIEPAEQLRSYGWSGDTALGILTNFAEFAIYDCRIEPRQGDSPEEARVIYLTHSQYLDQWERLRATLSPDAVRQGAHRDLLEATAKGVLRVDEAFLRDMENWRVDLAEHLHKQARFIDRQLNQRELNHLVQRTIDRIVFLRIAEDRNLESYGRLERAASVRRGVYNEIKRLYLAADRRYNSGLFHFDPADKSRPDADTLSMEIYIVDNVLRRIIGDLYPPRSRYQFSVISADILGQVYERFLGKVIQVHSDGERTSVTVEEKPEVRKAGGVYYTPGYIVDYIVENTVGALLRDRSPEQAAQLRVLDPACGSGSFLTGAYDYLLDWHLAQYRAAPERWKNRIRHSADGIILRIEEKRRILLENIYGVDLDQNAVEVSKLSLLLKMLENEHDTLDIEEPLLPDLSGNIKWGNSLIGSDFFSPAELAATDDEELYRVKPFDWAGAAGFASIMAAGGFNAVIGNPPYGAKLNKEERAYLRKKFKIGTTDTAALMMMQAKNLCSATGISTFIVPKPFLYASNWRKTRAALLENLMFIVDVGKVWKEVKLEQTIYQISNSEKPPFYRNFVRADQRFVEWSDVSKQDCVRFNFYINRISNDEISLAKRLAANNEGLGKLVDNTRGGMFQRLIDEDGHAGKYVLGGKQVNRYCIEGHRGRIIDAGHLSDKAYVGKGSILIQNIVAHIMNPVDHIKIIGTIPEEEVITNYVILDTINQLKNNSNMSSHYLLGLLLSKLINWYVYRFIFGKAIRTMHFDKPVTDRIPIRAIDYDNPADVATHDEIVALVDTMLSLHKQLPELAGIKREVIEAQIEATDREIDGLVYRLYGLSDDEIKIIEGG